MCAYSSHIGQLNTHSKPTKRLIYNRFLPQHKKAFLLKQKREIKRKKASVDDISNVWFGIV